MFHWRFLITNFFSVSLSIWACSITDRGSKFRVNNAILCSHIFFDNFLCFLSKFFFSHFFWWSIKSPPRNINQYCQRNYIISYPVIFQCFISEAQLTSFLGGTLWGHLFWWSWFQKISWSLRRSSSHWGKLCIDAAYIVNSAEICCWQFLFLRLV